MDRPVTPTLVSLDPATGAQVWSGEIGDAAGEVAAARAAWPVWAAHSVAYRIEAVRRFGNVVRRKDAEFAELISKETGKPFWEARTEVAAVIRDKTDGGRSARKVSLRSADGRVDVSAIARIHGGGGHRRAAGFGSDLPYPELVDFLRAEIAAQRG